MARLVAALGHSTPTDVDTDTMTATGKWIALATLAAALIGGGSAAAAPNPRPCLRAMCGPWRPLPLHIELVSAQVCKGVLLASLNLETLNGTEWTPRQDDGRQEVQLFFIGNGLGSGAWESVDATSAGEGHLRLDLRYAGLPTYSDKVRLIRTDGSEVTSSAKPILDSCPNA